MKLIAIWCSVGFLATVSPVLAQQFPTNNLDAAQAVKLASGLRVGMPEQDVATILDERNGLKSGGDAGDNFGWTRFYLLKDGCWLDLQMDPNEVKNGGGWGGNGLLRSGSIQSNGVQIISVTLTNAPPPDGATNRSQPAFH